MAPLDSSYTSGLKILVGPKEEAFFSFEDVLCANSSFFKAACDKDWKEDQDKTIKLPDIEPHVFCCYLDWVYHGDFDDDRLQQCDMRILQTEEEIRARKICHNLCKLWTLADYLQDISCKNNILRSLLERSQAPSFGIVVRTQEVLACHTSPPVEYLSMSYRLDGRQLLGEKCRALSSVDAGGTSEEAAAAQGSEKPAYRTQAF